MSDFLAYYPVKPLHGYFQTSEEKYQMVPVGGVRILKVVGPAVRTLEPRLRPYSRGHRLGVLSLERKGDSANLYIHGRAAGRTTLEWVARSGKIGDSQSMSNLTVSFKSLREIRISFRAIFYDNGYRVSKTGATIDEAVLGANNILFTQSNMRLVRRSFHSIHVKEMPVELRTNEMEKFLKGYKDPSADRTVFCVAFLRDKKNEPIDGAASQSDPIVCISERPQHKFEIVLAHEMVHSLGFHEHTAMDSHLMHEKGRGLQLTAKQIDTINPSGT